MADDSVGLISYDTVNEIYKKMYNENMEKDGFSSIDIGSFIILEFMIILNL